MNRSSPSRSIRQALFEALGLAASAQAGLWTLDVFVNLGLVKKVFRPHHLLGSPVDFLGLFLADLQVALLAVALAWVLGSAFARMSGRGEATLERVTLVASMLVGLVVTVGSTVIWGALTGLVSWFALRFAFKRHLGPGSFGMVRATSHIIWPVLVAGFGVHGVDYASTGTWAPAAANTAAAILALAGGGVVLRLGTRRWALAFGWLPLWVALALAVQLSVRSAFFYGQPTASTEGKDATRPNVILIVLDTVRADHLKAFGHDRDTMPALERWARDALVATRAVSPAGWTTPAHASIFSGKSVSEHGIHYGSGTKRRDPFRTQAFEGVRWLPELLAEHGYDCLAVSANQFAVPQELTGFRRVLSPDHSDWERTVGGFVDRYSPVTARLSERLRWRMPYVDAGKMVDIAMRAAAGNSSPVFLFMNLIDAHSPYHPPLEALKSLGIPDERLFSRYLSHGELTQRWDSFPEGKDRYLNGLYDGELRWLDTHLDRLLTWIDQRFGEDALVIVTSDHGEELGEQGRVGHEYGLAQSLIHVPLFVRSPGLVAGRVDDLINLRSLFDFIKASAAGEEPGLKTLLNGSGMSERYPCGACVSQGAGYGRPWVSIIEGPFKAVGPSAYGLELYRIDGPRFDREAEHADPSLKKTLGGQIDRHWERSRDRRETNASTALSKEEWQRLKALGYVN